MWLGISGCVRDSEDGDFPFELYVEALDWSCGDVDRLRGAL